MFHIFDPVTERMRNWDTVYYFLFVVKVSLFTSLPSFAKNLLRLPAFTSFHNIHVHTSLIGIKYKSKTCWFHINS